MEAITSPIDNTIKDIKNCSHLEVAIILQSLFGEKVKYSPGFGWCFYDDDEKRYYFFEEAELKVQNAIEEYVQKCSSIYGHSKTTESSNAIKGYMNLLKSKVKIKEIEFDSDPFILNTPDGIVNLETCQKVPNDPKCRCSKVTSCSPGIQGNDEFNEFLDAFTQYDKSLQDYLQLVFGMMIVGKVYEESLIIFCGSGGNGKSTLCNAISITLGDYASTIDSMILINTSKKKWGAELATLKGARYVLACETEADVRLNEAMLKKISSTDKIRAEAKYYAPFDFWPTHHLLLFTNHLPKVGSTDHGTWRRLVVIPCYMVEVSDDKKIMNYASVLAERCGPAILSWLIEGANKYIANGCKLGVKPSCVQSVINDWYEETDWLSRFIEDKCETGEEYEESGLALYSAYKSWCHAEGESFTRDNKGFATALKEYGYIKKHTRNGSVWCGLKIAMPLEMD